MSALALGFAASNAMADVIFTSFPDAGGFNTNSYNPTTVVSLPVKDPITGAESNIAVNNPVISSDLKSLTLYANQTGGFSDTLYQFTFTSGGVINFNWKVSSGVSDPVSSVQGSYFVYDPGDPSNDIAPSLTGAHGNLVNGILTSQNSSESGSSSVTIPAGNSLIFELVSTQEGAGKTPASLDVTVVPEPATWISAFLLLGAVSLTFIKSKNSASTKVI